MNRKNEVPDNFIEISFQVGAAAIHNLSSLDKIGKTFLPYQCFELQIKTQKTFKLL